MERIQYMPGRELHVRFNTTPDQDANDKRMRAGVRAIKQEARGRTCGDCAHFHGWWCDEIVSVTDNALEVAASSVACSSFKKG